MAKRDVVKVVEDVVVVSVEPYDLIGPGKQVKIQMRSGGLRVGRAVMLGPAGWVLNMGGQHGTPAIATRQNCWDVGEKSRNGKTVWAFGRPSDKEP